MARGPIKVGKPVRGSSTGRPIMALLDLLGRRWSLRALWELRDGPQTFRDLQQRCGDISPTVLNRRLKELRDAALIEHGDGGYRYTTLGVELTEQIVLLDAWSNRWAKAAHPAKPK